MIKKEKKTPLSQVSACEIISVQSWLQTLRCRASVTLCFIDITNNLDE